MLILYLNFVSSSCSGFAGAPPNSVVSKRRASVPRGKLSVSRTKVVQKLESTLLSQFLGFCSLLLVLLTAGSADADMPRDSLSSMMCI